MQQQTCGNAPAPITLVTAVAKAQATDKMLHVVDEALRRSAEAREERERLEADQRQKEERDNRIEEAKRVEEESARRLAERNERVAEDIATREAARRALAAGNVWPLNVVI
jgi:hypothetical protein